MELILGFSEQKKIFFFEKNSNFFSNRLIDRYLRYRSFGDFKWLQLPNHKRWSSEIKKHKGFDPKGFGTLEMLWSYQIFDRTPGFRNSPFGSRIFCGALKNLHHFSCGAQERQISGQRKCGCDLEAVASIACLKKIKKKKKKKISDF